jgi:GSH-dependent disulfide-bond oxidoreductase
MAQSKAPPFTLYEFRPSPFCVAVRIALNECEAQFTPREVDLKKPKTAAFLKRSAFGKLPTLVEHRPGGELAVFESPAILLFLSERFPKSSIGINDIPSKAQSYSWLSSISSGLATQIIDVLTENYIYEGEDFRRSIATKKLEELEVQLDVLDKHLARRAYLAGDYSIADTLATPMLDLLEKVKDLELDRFPQVLSWRERLRARTSYKNVWPYNDEVKS